MSAYEIYSRDDEEAAFVAFYQAYSSKLLRYCQYRLRDRHEAEDVVQEAFVRAWRTMPAASPESNFYPWLRVVAGNLCTDVLRKRSRSEPVAAIDPGAVDGDIDRIADESDRVLVRQALGRLNDRHRSALMMRESEGLTYDQIAQRTGVTPGTVESLLWRARQALRREFLAGPGGCLAVLPVLPVLLVSRLRDAGHRTWVRLVRRITGIDASSDAPLAHAAVAAVAALTVATGVVATLEMGGPHGGSGVLVGNQTGAASTRLAQAPGSVAGAAPAPSAKPSRSPATYSPVSSATTVSSWHAGGVTTAGAGRGSLRVADPVTIGRAAADNAYTSPVTVDVGNLTVGASPPAVTGYVQSVTQRGEGVASATNMAVRAVKETTP